MRTTHLIAAALLLTPLAACDDPTSAPSAVESRDLSDVPPDVPLPADLELCVLKLDLCVARLERDACGEPDPAGLVECSERFDDCGYDVLEYHDPSCRMTYAFCRLELSDESPKWYHLQCAKAATTCGA